MNEETRKKLCGLLEHAEDETFRQLVEQARKKEMVEFWMRFDSLNKLLDMDIRLQCTTELAK